MPVSVTTENPPPITEPTKRAGHEIEKGWPVLKAAPRAVASVSFLSGLLGFCLAWYIVVASKNATIETLSTSTKEKDSTIDLLQKENDKLQKQNLELKTAIAEFAAPLKKRTLILANQLIEFIKQRPNGESLDDTRTDYENRFPGRNAKIVLQLDEVGQHSDTLNKALSNVNFYDPSTFVTNVMTVANELERLANNLKE